MNFSNKMHGKKRDTYLLPIATAKQLPFTCVRKRVITDVFACTARTIQSHISLTDDRFQSISPLKWVRKILIRSLSASAQGARSASARAGRMRGGRVAWPRMRPPPPHITYKEIYAIYD